MNVKILAAFVIGLLAGGYIGVKYAGPIPSGVEKMEVSDLRPSTAKEVEVSELETDTGEEATPNNPARLNTSSWAMYRNESLGFQIKLPPEYEALENHPDVAGVEAGPLLIRPKGKETTGNTIAFTKERNSLPLEIAERFTWRVYLIEDIPELGYHIMSYRSGDAFDIFKTYLAPVGPSSELTSVDQDYETADIIVAEIHGGREKIDVESIEEAIMGTFKPI